MNTGNTLFAFIAGAATGAAVALLLAPESGEKTRAKICKAVSGVADVAKGRILESLDAIEAALEEK